MTTMVYMEKICIVCGAKMTRKRRPSGQLERADQFESRVTCSEKCGGLIRRKRACVVCGDTHPNRMKSRVQVCDKPMCKALLFNHPGLIDPERTNSYTNPPPTTKGNRKPSHEDLHACINDIKRSDVVLNKHVSAINQLANDLHIDPSTLQVDGAYTLTNDERGSGGCQDDVWSYLSRKSSLIKIKAKHPSESGLTIHRPKRKTVTEVVRKTLLNSSGNETLCDVFYAWQCGCAYQHTLEYTRLEDLPQMAGWHDACPRCGASPLEVIDE